MILSLQRTEISISGGGPPLEVIVVVSLLVLLVIVVVIWLYRSVRKNIQVDDDWHYDEYSLMKRPPAAQQAPASSENETGPASDMEAAGPPAFRAVDVRSPEPDVPIPTPVPSLALPPEPVELREQEMTVERPAVRPADPVHVPTQQDTGLSSPAVVKPPDPVPVLSAQPPAGPADPGIQATNRMPAEAPGRPQPDEQVFRAYEYETRQDHRRRNTLLIVGGSIVLLAAMYFLVFPVQEAVDSAAAGLGERLSQVMERRPSEPDRLTTLPQLEIVQDVSQIAGGILISGRVRNASSDTLRNLFAEIALVPVGVELSETRLVPIEPQSLGPNQEGQYRLEVMNRNFAKYQLARIVTAERQEIRFKLSMTFPSSADAKP